MIASIVLLLRKALAFLLFVVSFVATIRMVRTKYSAYETTAYRWARLGYLPLTLGMLLGPVIVRYGIDNGIAQLDVLLEARDRGLYSAVTDCGAGGFSSAVGEMGE